MKLCDAHKISAFVYVTIPNPNSTLSYLDRGRYKVFEASLNEYPDYKFAAKLIPDALLEPETDEYLEFSRDVSCLR